MQEIWNSIYIVTYYINWVKTSWTYSTLGFSKENVQLKSWNLLQKIKKENGQLINRYTFCFEKCIITIFFSYKKGWKGKGKVISSLYLRWRSLNSTTPCSGQEGGGSWPDTSSAASCPSIPCSYIDLGQRTQVWKFLFQKNRKLL